MRTQRRRNHLNFISSSGSIQYLVSSDDIGNRIKTLSLGWCHQWHCHKQILPQCGLHVSVAALSPVWFCGWFSKLFIKSMMSSQQVSCQLQLSIMDLCILSTFRLPELKDDYLLTPIPHYFSVSSLFISSDHSIINYLPKSILLFFLSLSNLWF